MLFLNKRSQTLNQEGENYEKTIGRFLVGFFCVTLCYSSAIAEIIGSSKTSGLVFKDTLTVSAEDDPEFTNVVCYTTDVEIGGPNIENPSNSSIACRLVGAFKGKPSSKKKCFQ